MREKLIDNKLFFAVLVIAIFYLSYLVVKPLVSILILALLLAVLFGPVFENLKKFFWNQNSIATPITIVLIFLCLIIPVSIVSAVAINQFKVLLNELGDFSGVEINLNSDESEPEFDSIEERDRYYLRNGSEQLPNNVAENSTKLGDIDVQKALNSANELLDSIPFLELEITFDQVRNTIGDLTEVLARNIGETLLNIASDIPATATNLIVFIIILSTLLPTQRRLKEFFITLSPLDDKIDQLYLAKVKAMAVSMVKGTFILSLVQGIICGLLLWLAGVEYILFWTVIYTLLAFIPNGTAIVSWPITIVLALTGNFVGAAIVFVGNLFIIANVDPILRPRLVSKSAYLHPALVLIGIVGGIQAFGFLGFIYGPVIMILLSTTFEVYVSHYKGKLAEPVSSK